MERGDLSGACATAFRALRRAPARGDAHLAVAHALYRSGMLREADSAWRAVLPGLAPIVRALFEDISPVASERDTAVLHHLPADEQPAFVERFWRENDPDLTTSENEARLEYWARATQAYFLFYDRKRRGWDERGEVYVRYGPPAEMAYNPVGEWGGRRFGTMPAAASNLLVWDYPELGDDGDAAGPAAVRALHAAHLDDPRPRPGAGPRGAGAPRRARSARAAGAACSRCCPRGRRRCRSRACWPASRGPSGPRVLAQFETPGGPADSLWAEWSVLDSAGVVRGARDAAAVALGLRRGDAAASASSPPSWSRAPTW